MNRLLAVAVVALGACGSTPRPPPAPTPPPLRPTPAAAPAVAPPAVLAYLDGTLGTLARKYVDPGRFDYRRMLAGALDGLEREVAEVITEVENDRVAVRVGELAGTFAGDVDSLAELGLRLSEVVHFIQAHADTEDRAIELAGVNGMLQTLDPHTHVITADEMEDWNTNLTGKFAGVGVTLGMRAHPSGREIVAAVAVFANTPAERGGVQAGDFIVAIDGQATDTFTLDEVAGRLRGEPGSTVELVLERGRRRIEVPLTRAEIRIPVIESRMLDGMVGYLMIDRFDGQTAADLEAAMQALLARGARAWVVDVRENVGGLLAQAVKAADHFVEYGTIVATVAGGKKHDIKNATSGGADPRRPVVVLIGERTASSAEIFAGALKQLDRAVLVGSRTFGKGSVQTLEDAAHGGKLKITIAEYVAAHDISPQGGGIAPDVELVPVVIPKQLAGDARIRMQPEPPFRETDLGAHIAATLKTDPDRPLATIHHLAAADDFAIDFARELALAGAHRTRRALLRAVPRVVKRARARAERAVAAALRTHAIDWSPGRAATGLVAKFPPALSATAGELVTFHAEVTNPNPTPAHRVVARAASADPTLDGLEIVLGKIAPRATARGSVAVRLPKGSASRTSTLRWDVAGIAATTELAIAGLPYPSFAVTAQLADANDGIARTAEPLRVRARVTNRGPGRAVRAVATLRSLVGDRLVVERGRVEVGTLEPGSSRDVELVFTATAKTERIAAELAIADGNVSAMATQKLEAPVGARVPTTRWELTPPRLEVATPPLETTADRIRITGTAEDEQVVRDLFITVSNRAAKLDGRKVHYVAGRRRRLDLAADVPLAPGPNRIVITAREHAQSQTTRTVWVVRR